MPLPLCYELARDLAPKDRGEQLKRDLELGVALLRGCSTSVSAIRVSDKTAKTKRSVLDLRSDLES